MTTIQALPFISNEPAASSASIGSVKSAPVTTKIPEKSLWRASLQAIRENGSTAVHLVDLTIAASCLSALGIALYSAMHP